MKLQLLVIGCCVALVVSKPAEDSCVAMRARMFPTLTASARADASGLRSCDADHDGAVDAAEFVSCVQRAIGSTAGVGRAEMGQRLFCFRGIMGDSALGAEQRQMIDKEEVRQFGSGGGSAAVGFNVNGGLSRLDCIGQNRLGQILTLISTGQLQTAYDALVNWYINIIAQTNGVLSGLLNSVSFILTSILSGRSLQTFILLVTEFVRSANNALTAPVEDALILALFEISVGNYTAAQIRIQTRLDAGVLNPVTQASLRAIIDYFNAGSVQDAVASIISHLAGYTATLNVTIRTELLGVYDELFVNVSTAKTLYYAVLTQIQQPQTCFSSQLLQALGAIALAFETRDTFGALHYLIYLLTSPCYFDNEFALSLASAAINIEGDFVRQVLVDIVAKYEGNLAYASAISFINDAIDALDDGDTSTALDEIRDVLEMCVDDE